MSRAEPSEAQKPSRTTYAALFLVSAATLLLQIGLTRVFSYTIWYHFAFIVIAVAMLGFGASGSVLMLRPRAQFISLRATQSRFALLAALSVALLGLVITLVPLDPFQVTKSPLQLLTMGLYLGAVTLPFFFAGSFIAIVLSEYNRSVGTLYFADLLGSGLACLGFAALLDALGPQHLMAACAALFALVAIWTSSRRGATVAASILALIVLELLATRLDFPIAKSKLASQYREHGAKIVHSDWSAIFRTDLYDFDDALNLDTMPSLTVYGSRHGGRGKGFEGNYPPFRMIAHDGDASAVMVKAVPAADDVTLLRHHLLGVPYQIRPGARVFMGGVGGGVDVLAALTNGAASIHGVELDPKTVDIVCNRYADYVGHACSRPNVKIHAGDARSVLFHSRERFDVINFTGVDTITSAASGAYLLSEGYLYTIEAFETYFDRLAPNGVVSIISGEIGGGWGVPRMIPRFCSVIAAVLERRGIEAPERHVLVMGSSLPNDAGLSHEVVLAKVEPFSPADIALAREIADREGFVFWHLPGERMNTPASELLHLDPKARAAHFDTLYLDYSAVSDDRPFFMHFYKWGSFLSHFKIDYRYVEATGNLVLLIALGFSVLGAVALIVWPARRYAVRTGAKLRWPDIAYFCAIGVGFMLLEVSIVQQLTVFLGYPTYSLSVTLFSILTFAALGSLLSQKANAANRRVTWLLVLALAAIITAHVVFGERARSALSGLPLYARCAIAALALAPLGTVLGCFFPLGLRALAERQPGAVPLAWAANGSCSVIGTVASVILATMFGFRAVCLLALGLYVGAGWAFQAARARAETSV